MPYSSAELPARYGGRPTNTFAILAIAFAFVVPGLAIVFGAIGRHQIDRSGEPGRGLATAGFVIGIVYTALAMLAFAAYLGFFVYLITRVGHSGTDPSPFPSPFATALGA